MINEIFGSCIVRRILECVFRKFHLIRIITIYEESNFQLLTFKFVSNLANREMLMRRECTVIYL